MKSATENCHVQDLYTIKKYTFKKLHDLIDYTFISIFLKLPGGCDASSGRGADEQLVDPRIWGLLEFMLVYCS